MNDRDKIIQRLVARNHYLSQKNDELSIENAYLKNINQSKYKESASYAIYSIQDGQIEGIPVMWLAYCPGCHRAYMRGKTRLLVNCGCGVVFHIKGGNSGERIG
jgi:hypothetical protein